MDNGKGTEEFTCNAHNVILSKHNELLQEIRKRESSIWKFWTILISALGTWSLALAGSSKYPKNPWLLPGASAFVLILLFWGVGVVLTYGYHYRSFQVVLCNIEKAYNLNEVIVPSSWNPCEQREDIEDIREKHWLYKHPYKLCSQQRCLCMIILIMLSLYLYALFPFCTLSLVLPALLFALPTIYFMGKRGSIKHDLPGIYKVHFRSFSFAIALVLVTSVAALLKEPDQQMFLQVYLSSGRLFSLCFSWFMGLGFTLSVVFDLYSQHILSKKMESACKES